MIDINYSRNVYEQAMAEGTGEGYYRAYAAIVYVSRASWLLQRVVSRFWIRRSGSNFKAGAGKRTCTCRCSI